MLSYVTKHPVGGAGGGCVKLDHLSRFASRCLTTPARGGKSYHRGHCTVELYFITPCDVFILKYGVFDVSPNDTNFDSSHYAYS